MLDERHWICELCLVEAWKCSRSAHQKVDCGQVVTGLKGSENEVAAVGGKGAYAAWAYDTDKIMMDNYDVCVMRLK